MPKLGRVGVDREGIGATTALTQRRGLVKWCEKTCDSMQVTVKMKYELE